MDPARTLNAQRNSLSFTLRLPIEILGMIFIHCADYYHTCCGHPTSTAPGWVDISYVCHHWRNVAVHCPTLWSYLFMTSSSRWTEVLLARSMHAPLKIRIDLRCSDRGPRELRILELLMNHVERIQEFRLQLPNECNDSVLDSFISKFSSRALRLEDLQISMAGYPPARTFIHFDGDTPALRALVLSCCAMPWYSLNLSGLTTLSLRDTVPVGFLKSMAEVLSTLDCMQGLMHLHRK